jgi:hypothetical protein
MYRKMSESGDECLCTGESCLDSLSGDVWLCKTSRITSHGAHGTADWEDLSDAKRTSTFS